MKNDDIEIEPAEFTTMEGAFEHYVSAFGNLLTDDEMEWHKRAFYGGALSLHNMRIRIIQTAMLANPDNAEAVQLTTFEHIKSLAKELNDYALKQIAIAERITGRKTI